MTLEMEMSNLGKPDDNWDTIAPEVVVKKFARIPGDLHSWVPSGGTDNRGPEEWAYLQGLRTRSGTLGVLQWSGGGNAAKGVKIRYRLVEVSSTNSPIGEAAQPSAFHTTTITRGDIRQAISAAGTLEPGEVIDVAAQVAGTIASLGPDPRGASDPSYKDKFIDYVSPVAEGTVLARIDDTLYKVRVEQQEANVKRAEAELAVVQAKAKGGDAEAEASVAVAEAAVAQTKAVLKEAQINLDRATIKSPVKGVVLDRRVNVGQVVDPGRSLFLIAKDTGKTQVWAQVNEADIGPIHKGMEASVTFDAFPKEAFQGAVAQIRENTTMTQDVVYYTVVVDVDNRARKLLPYLTANVQFQVAKRPNVLRVRNTALRWKPTPDLVAPEARPAVAAAITPLWAIAPDGKHVRPVVVQIGLTDGTMTELSGTEVKEGLEVVDGQAAQSSQGPRLQFRLVAEAADANAETLPGVDSKESFRLGREVLLDQSAVASASVSTAADGHPQINLTFTKAAAEKFAALTTKNIGKKLAIVFDGKVLQAPVIRNAIVDGRAVITGRFTLPGILEAIQGNLKGDNTLADPLKSARAAQMRTIILAGLEYATEHPEWPDNLDDLAPKYLDAGKIDLGQFVYHNITRDRPEKNPQEVIVLAEKEPAFAGGQLVGFADGYIEFIRDPERLKHLWPKEPE
jgi:HlyD family secretion protein